MEPRIESVILEYQPLIEEAPSSNEQLFARAASNDEQTIAHWKNQWLTQIKANKEKFGSFWDHNPSSEWGKYKYGAAVIAGSGPSLKYNAHLLKDRGDMPLVSCLHNFHYFEELDLAPEYYCSLDAGYDITTEEMLEGGSKDEEWYWERTRDRTLVCFIATSPKLLDKWRGRVLFFNSAIPDEGLCNAIDAVENYKVYFSTGGNVLGSCLYMAKAILGCYSTIFVGADFSFGYPVVNGDSAYYKFHSWDSKYDKTLGKTHRVTDIYGNKVHTWPSYFNFKSYFDFVASSVPGYYINACEGGCLGSYNEGNIRKFDYMPLEVALRQFNGWKSLEEPLTDPEYKFKRILYR